MPRAGKDSLQSILPGYRERIVTVNLSEEEGGMNLDMPPDLITDLTELGKEAGRQIVEQFDLNEHRWRRLLVEVRAIDEMLVQFAEAYDRSPPRGGVSYPDIATRHEPRSFKNLTDFERGAIKDRADRIAELGRQLKVLTPAFKDLARKLPRSRSHLRSQARMDD